MKIVPVEYVVAQHQSRPVVVDERFADDEGLRQTIRRSLHGVSQVQAPLLTRAKQLLKTRSVLRRGNNQNLAYARQHEGAERVIDHRLIEHRQ